MKKILNKSLAFILALAMLVVIIPISNVSVSANQSTAFSGGYSTNYTLTGNGASDIVTVARAQLGKTQAQLKYTEAWCDNFVSDCAILANQASAVPQGGAVSDFRNKLINAGANQVSSPIAGDIVILYCNNCGSWAHAGIMYDGTHFYDGNNWTGGYSHVHSTTCGYYMDECGNTSYISYYYYRPNYNSHTHSYGAWQVVTAATCTASGTSKRVCSCGDTQTRTDAATGHSWNSGEIITSAECTSNGVKKYTCTKCGATKTEAISATGHTPVTDEAVAATCTETGLTEGTHCSVCNAIIVEQQTVPALGHDYKMKSYERGCETVTATYKCNRCSDIKKETKDDYILSDWLEEKPADVDESLLEEKRQSAHSDKSTTTSSSSTLDGWVQDGKEITSYGTKIGPVYSNPSNGERKVTSEQYVVSENTKTVWHYSRSISSASGWNNYSVYISPNMGNQAYDQSIALDYQLTNTDANWQGLGARYGKYIYNGFDCPYWFNEWSENVVVSQNYGTRWYYQEPIYTYSYYKWSDYSDWSDTEYTESETRQVKTRTLYRYKITPTGHTAGDTWQADGTNHWHECTECGEIIDLSAHTYESEGATTCTICGYERKIAVKSDTKLSVQSTKALTGKEFTLSIDLVKNPGLAYLKLAIDYNSDIFEMVSAENMQVLGGTFTTSKTKDVKPYILQWMGAENSDGNGTVAKITFKVKDNAATGDYTISLNVLESYNEAFNDVVIEPVDGTVTVLDVAIGDFNGDGIVNGKDGILCSQALAGWDVEYEAFAADVNGDGVFNGKDGILLSQYLAGWDVVLG